MVPRSGEVLRISKRTSVQFTQPFQFRVIRVHDFGLTDDGWTWLDGYQLDGSGEAIERRSLYLPVDKLERVSASARRAPRTVHA